MKSWDSYRVISKTDGAVFEGDRFGTEDYVIGLVADYNEAMGGDLAAAFPDTYILSEGNRMMLEDVLNIVIEPLE